MTKHLFNQLALITAGVALSLTAESQLTPSAIAAVITYDFQTTVTGTNLPQYGLIDNYTGSFSYDDSTGTTIGSSQYYNLLDYSDTYRFTTPWSPMTASFVARTDNGVFAGLFGQRFPFLTGGFIVTYEGNKGNIFLKGFDPSLPPPDAIYGKVDFFDMSYFLRKSQC